MKKFSSYALLFLLGICSVNAQSSRYPSHTWKKISVKSKIGFVDPEGNVVIEPQFEHASDFNNGAAFVWFYPGREEDKKSVPLGEAYKSYERFNLEGNSRTGIIDSTGKYIVEPKINFNWAGFQNGIGMVRINNKIELVDRNGKIIYRSSSIVLNDKNSVLLKARYDEKLPVKWCFMNTSKELVMGPFDDCQLFSEDLAVVRLGNQFGYVNRNGDMVLHPQFQSAGTFNQGHAAVSVDKGDENRNGAYGIIDTSGTFVIPPNYKWLGIPSDGMVPFSAGANNPQQYGFLNLKGEVIIEAQYANPSQFSEGLAPVEVNGKMGYINTNGEMVIRPKFRHASGFQHGSAYVFIGKKKRAIINAQGEIVWGPQKP